jgi:F0F1-type ATP synthase assembly protein I
MPMGPQQPHDPGKQRREPNPWSLAGAGFEFGAVVAALGLLGWWLDGKWSTQPWLLIVGVAVGVSGGLFKLWKTGKRFFE